MEETRSKKSEGDASRIQDIDCLGSKCCKSPICIIRLIC